MAARAHLTVNLLIDGTTQVDTITERTSAAGVTVDTVLLKDGAAEFPAATDQLTLGSASGTRVIISAPAPAATRRITMPDPGADASLVVSAGASTLAGTRTFTDGIATDTIAERTGAAGVTIDGTLCKDGALTAPADTALTLAAGARSGTGAGRNVEINAGNAVTTGGGGSVVVTPGTSEIIGGGGQLAVNAASNQMRIGLNAGPYYTIHAPAPAGFRTLQIADPGDDAAFVLNTGASTFYGKRTFSDGVDGYYFVAGSAPTLTVDGTIAFYHSEDRLGIRWRVSATEGYDIFLN
jgi:hypothetical protein